MTPRPLPDRDTITLRAVRAWGHHGVLQHEKDSGQEFLVDATLHLGTRPAARDDALGRTVNYAEIAASIVDEVGTGSHDLIETLADSLASRILAEQVLIRRLELTIHKPSAPIPHPFADVELHIARDADPVDAVLAVGGNIGDREGRLERALALLEEADGVHVDWTGPVVETAPVGGVDQADFLNSVIGVRTELGPWELLDLAHDIERDAHRERPVRWGPRTLDVDVIRYGDLLVEDPDLTLPHPRAHERAFVLAPWDAADPTATLPSPDGERPVADLLRAAPDAAGVRPGTAVRGYGRRADGSS